MRWFVHTTFSLLVLLAPVCGAVGQTTHDELKGFWSKGDARNWDTAVNPNSSQAVSYRNYPLVVDKVKEDAEKKKTLSLPNAVQNPENPQNLAQNEQNPTPLPQTTPLSRDQIVAKFGAPDSPQPIRAQKDSPPAMQGLFEALNSNDKELAWQYAVALAKRQVEMQSVVSKATDYQMLAMEAIGIRESAPEPDDGEALDPIRAEVRDFMTQTRQQELQKRVSIDPSLGEGSEALGTDPFSVPDPSAGGEAKAALKQPLIPIDPEGKVKLLVFVDEKANSSAALSESLRPLRERFKGDTNFSVVGLTRRTYSANGLKLLGAQLSFPYPLVSGEALALDLRIKSYPTFVFVAVTSQQTYRLEGTPSVEEIEKVVKVMRGGR
jgi:hypothetical protein